MKADREKAKAKRKAELATKLDDQGGRCVLCGTSEATWHYDHDHETGALRDVLCSKCNNGMGFFNDDPQRLRKAAEYIERHKAPV